MNVRQMIPDECATKDQGITKDQGNTNVIVTLVFVEVLFF